MDPAKSQISLDLVNTSTLTLITIQTSGQFPLMKPLSKIKILATMLTKLSLTQTCIRFIFHIATSNCLVMLLSQLQIIKYIASTWTINQLNQNASGTDFVTQLISPFQISSSTLGGHRISQSHPHHILNNGRLRRNLKTTIVYLEFLYQNQTTTSLELISLRVSTLSLITKADKLV